jgi:hypothetical protein
VLDGEIVVYNEHGQIEFGALQERRGRFRTHSKSIGRGEVFDDVPVGFSRLTCCGWGAACSTGPTTSAA